MHVYTHIYLHMYIVCCARPSPTVDVVKVTCHLHAHRLDIQKILKRLKQSLQNWDSRINLADMLSFIMKSLRIQGSKILGTLESRIRSLEKGIEALGFRHL